MAKAHLVGSMNLPDAETVFRAVAEQCGDAVARILTARPDRAPAGSFR